MTEIEKLLAAYGVDWQTVGERFGGDAGFYLKCVRMFTRDGSYDLLEKSLDGGDMDTAFRAAHTIKGMAANMGFTGVLDAACAIVEPLRAHQTDIDYAVLVAGLGAQMRRIKDFADRGGRK